MFVRVNVNGWPYSNAISTALGQCGYKDIKFSKIGKKMLA